MNRYGLIGYPLSHSFSEHFFTEKFHREGITDCVYENFPLENIRDVKELIENNPDIRGLNITIPYKEKILPYLSDSNDIVKTTGACNCIAIHEGNLSGYNTDVIGFEKSLVEQLQPHHNRALILGEGGAAKAVAYVLEKLKIEYKYVIRKGESDNKRVLYDDLSDAIMTSYTLIINSTPLGMYPAIKESPRINYDFLTSRHYLYDLIYNPEKTLFLQKGEEKGATIQNGLEMLIIQAEESWRIWAGRM